jgi:hypothetical protein
VWLGLAKLKKSNNLVGNRTGDLPVCSIVPQTTELSRAPSQRRTSEILLRTETLAIKRRIYVCCSTVIFGVCS